MLSTTLTAPIREPVAVGAKLTLMVHIPPTASGEDEVHVSVSVKSPKAPTGPTRKLWLLLTFVIVTVCDELLVPTFWLPKSRAVGVVVVTGGGTETGTEAVTLCVPTVYVAVIVALPFATALIRAF